MSTPYYTPEPIRPGRGDPLEPGDFLAWVVRNDVPYTEVTVTDDDILEALGIDRATMTEIVESPQDEQPRLWETEDF